MVVEHFPVLVVAVSLISAYTILVAGWLNRKSSCFISIATITFQLILALFILHHVLTWGTIHYPLGGWAPPWGIEYVVDALNAYVLVILLFASLLVAIYSWRSIQSELPAKKTVSFYVLFQLLVTGLCGITVTGDMFNLYVFLEISSLAAYALIAAAGGRALKASYNYVIMGSIGACFYLLGVGFLYAVTGSLNMADLMSLLPPLYGNRVVQAAFVFFVIGMSIKMALFPLHLWQPDAYTYAPSAVSAYIAATMSHISVYALIRVIFSVFTLDFVKAYIGMDLAICWVAAIGIIAGSVLAIAQNNFKRMLAYSSVSQIGYIVLGMGLAPATTWGFFGAVAHILNHTIMKGCLFLVAGAFIYKAGLRDIREFRGLGKRMPYTSAVFTIAALSMIGVPPTVGFATKLFLMVATLETYNYAFAGVLLLNSLLELVYFGRLIERIYLLHEEPESESELNGGTRDEKRIPYSMLIPMFIFAALCIIAGIFWLTNLATPLIEPLTDLCTGVMP
ncbi:MAG: monovalent cation/H+ antiporter subunit D family protein [Methanophagales archaeon]|nr:monovalent cation/H+ antiporter subunit D family protein [Methanophagales archaeon]